LRREEPEPDSTTSAEHPVTCTYCRKRFDLFAAAWCDHFDFELSKICPHCQNCLCAHPVYREPHFWKEAPPAFRKRGFRKLFLLYM